MRSFTPIFKEIVDSSLWEEEPHVVKLFLTFMALKDADHVARIEKWRLPRKAGLTPEQIESGLKILENPDKKWGGKEQEYEGRRVKKVEEGWLVLNGQKYQERMCRIFEQARWAKSQAAKRERDRKRREQN